MHLPYVLLQNAFATFAPQDLDLGGSKHQRALSVCVAGSVYPWQYAACATSPSRF